MKAATAHYRIDASAAFQADWRALAQRLSRVAVVTDRVAGGLPPWRADGINYQQRQLEIEREARRELKELRDVLSGMELE
jgi:hypothetical protein